MAMGHLFSYRTYYAVNSLGLEREEDKSSQIYCLLQPLLLSTTQYCTGLCCPTPHIAQALPGAEQSQIKSGTVPCCVVVFPAPSVPVGFADLGSNAVAWCDWTDRQTLSAPGHCGPKSGWGSPESTYLPWLFQELVKNMCGSAVNQAWSTPARQ